jgi:hypothetical protein
MSLLTSNQECQHLYHVRRSESKEVFTANKEITYVVSDTLVRHSLSCLFIFTCEHEVQNIIFLFRVCFAVFQNLSEYASADRLEETLNHRYILSLTYASITFLSFSYFALVPTIIVWTMPGRFDLLPLS